MNTRSKLVDSLMVISNSTWKYVHYYPLSLANSFFRSRDGQGYINKTFLCDFWYNDMPCLSYLIAKYEQYNKQYINHIHRVDCCINCVLVFDRFFTIILLVELTSKFYWNFRRKKLALQTVIRKCLYCLQMHLYSSS